VQPPEPWASQGFFPDGGNSGFFQRKPRRFFQGAPKVVKFHISLPKLQTHISLPKFHISLPKNFIFPSRKTTLFAKNVIRKCQISKYREPYPLPTPMHRMIPFCFETWKGCFKKHAKVSRIWFATSRSIQTSLLSLRLAKNICFDKNRSVRLLFATNLFLKLPKSQLIAS